MELGQTLLEAAKLQVKLNEGTEKINELHADLSEILRKSWEREQEGMTGEEFINRLTITNKLIREINRAHNMAALVLRGAIDGYEKELQDAEAI